MECSSSLSPTNDQQHHMKDLIMIESKLLVKPYPYRFSVANKFNEKLFYRCMECRNIRLKQKKHASSYIVGNLVFNKEENILNGNVTAPGGYAHICDDPKLCPLPLVEIENLDQKLEFRTSIHFNNFELFNYGTNTIKLQTLIFKKVGCTEGFRYYACHLCVFKHALADIDNCIIFDIHKKVYYSNVNGLNNLTHACKTPQTVIDILEFPDDEVKAESNLDEEEELNDVDHDDYNDDYTDALDDEEDLRLCKNCRCRM